MTDAPDLTGPLNGDECRDAVHVAICPVTAGEDLLPGQHVGLVAPITFFGAAPIPYETVVVGGADKKIGVVNPFIRFRIKKGEPVYVFLYPRTVTGMRHTWTHPDLPDPDR
jgi:hypothetical protein